MTVYSNYSGNYNGFRHIIADNKIQRGDRRAKRTQVIQLAEYFNIDKNELLTLWLADKVLDAVEDEDELKHDAIEVAQKRIG